jgi:hypothetical protein
MRQTVEISSTISHQLVDIFNHNNAAILNHDKYMTAYYSLIT